MAEDKGKKTILIVEDDPFNMRLTVDLLQINGFDTLSCCDGTIAEAKKGFDLAVSSAPDLVLLDIMMPDVDGTRVHESLSQNAKTKDVPVVFLTALVKEEEVEAGGGKIGGLDYISKSTPKEKFVMKVKEILSKKK